MYLCAIWSKFQWTSVSFYRQECDSNFFTGFVAKYKHVLRFEKTLPINNIIANQPLNFTRCVCGVMHLAPEWQQSWYVSILVNACASTGCGCFSYLLRRSSGDLEPSAADTQGFYFCRMMEHNAGIQHRADRAEQEVRHRYNIKTSG